MTDLISIDEVRAQENISSSADDAELLGYIDAVTSFMRRRAGDVIPTTYTEVHNGGKPQIVLDHSPVISITTLTEYVGLTAYVLTSQPLGSTTSNYGYSIDNPDAGIVTRRNSSGMAQTFYGGPKSVAVTYVAGRLSTDPDLAALKLAALLMVENLWVTQRGSSQGRPVPGFEDMAQLVPNVGLPYRAVELLTGERPPAIA